MTSSSTGTPFSTSSITGFNDFQDKYAQNETFIANFSDSSDNYMVAICSLDGSNNVVVDQVLASSAGATDLTIPTFSGTVNILIAASTHNTKIYRFRNCSSNDADHDHYKHLNGGLITATGNAAYTNDRLYLFSHHIECPGWYYGFYTAEKSATSADYRVGLYDLNEAGHPDIVLCQSAIATHGGGSPTDKEIDFNNTLTITDISIASVGVVTYTGTDPSNGDRVYITGVVGTVGDDVVNQKSFLVSNVNTGSNTFELHDLTNTDVDTSGKTYTSGGTVHFPVFLSAGDYMSAFVCDTNALNFNSATMADELAMPSFFGVRTGMSMIGTIFKSFTYGAFTNTPDMTTGWSDADFTKYMGIALLMVEG